MQLRFIVASLEVAAGDLAAMDHTARKRSGGVAWRGHRIIVIGVFDSHISFLWSWRLSEVTQFPKFVANLRPGAAADLGKAILEKYKSEVAKAPRSLILNALQLCDSKC